MKSKLITKKEEVEGVIKSFLNGEIDKIQVRKEGPVYYSLKQGQEIDKEKDSEGTLMELIMSLL